MTEYYKQYFLKDLCPLTKKTKVLVTGVVIDMKIKEKLAIFSLDDTTGIIECILFKPADKKLDIQIGSILTISGDFEIEEYHKETNLKITVSSYSVLEDVNQELLFYLSTLTENSLGGQETKETVIEVDTMEYVPPTEKKIKKRIPLSDETTALKIRSLLFKYVKEEIFKNPLDENLYTSTSDMLTCKQVSDFMEVEDVDSAAIENGILDLERLNFISPIYEHSMVETSGTRYMIETKSVLRVEDQIMSMIKDSGSNGIKVAELCKSLNELYDPNTYMFTQHYVWEVANSFYEKNKVFLGANNVIHYMERL